ncbi:Adaptor complexes medium subunit family-domain-containing protein [Exophiala viscosa]|uniref:Adaptor complexes medium subunit family-domain-containing protein n=1 Tax=Exophiala viscosa TaxID=2486360 RepID=A0AAN6DLY5_9EURO|nr:Adaptor complexes medium subunit family-domain-containing protein [Exophiala viscosa]
MSVSIDALYIFDDHRNPVLEHIYTGRPPSAQVLIASYTSRPSPRPAVLQLADVAPPVTVYSISHSSLLIIAVAAKDAQSLAILDFLHRLVDIFEDFLGSPLLTTKIEENYEIVAQILGEVCDGGIICNTEPNALRESVEVSSGLGKFLTHVGLPGSSQALAPSSSFGSSLRAGPTQASGPAIPWRKSKVRHTSNELYVDIVETLSVVFAPSGRPISARAHGSVAFTAKISGVPDLLLNLSAPGGTSNAKSAGIARTMQIPVFHPCVRLARWKEHPGELSFIPPDGRFMLAGYETDLMPSSLNSDEPPSKIDRLFLPANADLRTGTGSSSSDFEARLTLNNNFPGVASSAKPNTTRTGSGPIGSLSFGNNSGSSSAPSLEAVMVTIPFPADVRNVTELRASRGEATFNAFDKVVEWKVSTKDGASVNGIATLTGSVVGPLNADSVVDDELQAAEVGKSNSIAGYYNEDNVANEIEKHGSTTNGSDVINRKVQASKALMPRSISVSFNVKGWLPSGVKVDSLMIDVKKSKGLGDGVKPYKGVKYLTVSRQGVERRVE